MMEYSDQEMLQWNKKSSSKQNKAKVSKKQIIAKAMVDGENKISRERTHFSLGRSWESILVRVESADQRLQHS